jgi:hypothetical protein
MIRFASLSVALGCALLLSACGGDAPASSGGSSSGAAAPAASPYLLMADLPEALDVFSAKEKGEGEEVMVWGRVREEVEGSGAFTIIDDTIDYCGRGQEDCGCPTPWDYCCELDKVPDASLAVEIRNAKGDVVDVGATDMRRLDLIAIKGILQKTESGGLILVSKDGWFRRERPELPEGLRWPGE